jgi:hypothetical protein
MSAKRILKVLMVLTVLTASFLFIRQVFAQIQPGINVVGAEIALPSADPRIVAARIVRVALGFLGVIALAIVLYGGFVWMTSAGNPEKIDKAKKILTNGVIGLIIIIFAFGITQYVLNALLGQYVTPGGGAPPPPPVVERLSGSLGNGIIESHYPPRGGTGIARNTKIIVTFKEQMSLESIINNYNDNDTPTDVSDDTVTKNDNGTPKDPADDWMELKAENIKIYKSIDGETAALAASQVKVTFTTDLKTFVFDPVDFLGSPSENIWYTVSLKTGIKKADGSDAFVGAFRDGYLWDFEVSTFVDTTPPQVESVIPREGSTNPRNILIQINFDEAMDPTTVSGKTAEGFDKIIVLADGSPVVGTWAIGNQYKTVEFTTDVACGTNSCGGTVYCLPENADIDVLVKAATLGKTPPEALWPYDGVTDVVGNSLDGDKNGTAEGSDLDTVSGIDNYGLSFSTNDTIDLTPPVIEVVTPEPGQGNIAFNAPVEMTFGPKNKIMSITSFTTENIKLEDNQRDECAVWFTLGGVNLKEDGTPVRTPEDVAVKTKAQIYHGNFLPSEATATCADGNPVDQTPAMYYPRATHNVKDIFQNCFFEPVGPEGGVKRTIPPSPPREPWE